MAYTHPAISGSSGAAISTGNRIPLLCDTADPIQKKFHCPREELFIWRQSFLYRFNTTNLSPNITVTIETRDFSETDLDLNDSYPPSLSCEIHPNLAKTIFRIHKDGRQILVITLYVKKCEDLEGTVLLQGPACPTVGMNEIEILRDIVTSNATRPKRTREMDSKFHLDLSNIPLNGFQNISNEEPLMDDNITSGHDKKESCTEDDSSGAEPGPTYGQGRVRKVIKKRH